MCPLLIEKLFVVAAHPDDELLGMGGSLFSLKDRAEIHLVFMSDGYTSRGKGATERNTGAEKVSEALNAKSLTFLGFEDNKMDNVSLLEIVKKFEKVLFKINPDTIFTHWYGDLNVDHQLTHRVVMTACRPRPSFPVRNILSFEVPSSTGWQSNSMSTAFNPNFFFNISGTIDQKLEVLKEAYGDELHEYPGVRSLEGIRNLAAYRGNTIGIPFAEAFILERCIATDVTV